MWIEFVVTVVVLGAVLGLVSRLVASRRGAAARTGEPTDGRRGGAWTAAGPLDAAFPVERTPRERAIGDAAFVDGLVIGHYIAPLRRDEDRDPVQPEPADLVPDGDDGTATTAWGPFDDAPSDEPADQTADDLDLDLDLDADAGYGAGVSSWDGTQEDAGDEASDDGFDDGFGFDDGLDDDW